MIVYKVYTHTYVHTRIFAHMYPTHTLIIDSFPHLHMYYITQVVHLLISKHTHTHISIVVLLEVATPNQ